MLRAVASVSPTHLKILAAVAALLTSVLLLRWIDLNSPAIADLRLKTMEMATISTPDLEAATKASYVAVSEPLRIKGPFSAARLTFHVTHPEHADLALFIRRVRDNYAVYVNGELASPIIGEISETPTLDGAQPRLTKILPSLLIPGDNLIYIVSARHQNNPFLREVYFGPVARLEPAYRHSAFIMRDLAEFALVAAAMVILFAIALSSIIQKPGLLITIALTLAFFILRELHTLWVSVSWTQIFRDTYFLVSATAVWTSCAALVNEWTSGHRQTSFRFLAFALVASTAIALTYLTFPMSLASELAAGIESVVELVTFSFMIVRLFKFYAKAPASAALEMFAAIVCLMMAIASIATQTAVFPVLIEFVSVEGEAFVQFGALSIITFIATGLARQGISVYQMAALNNETLAKKVRDREQEIELHHAKLQSQEAARVLLAERGRIMSDVHDGIGSQLLGLLLQARSEKIGKETIIAGLQSALDDLYLVVDSLDTVSGSLSTALGSFRSRIEPKCQAAGASIIWEIPDQDLPITMTPTTTLQICRILQEAVSNSLRHGQSTKLSFKLAMEQSSALLTLADNGKGFDTASASPHGRGLGNMRKRANSIGAGLDISSTPVGTTLTLKLPA